MLTCYRTWQNPDVPERDDTRRRGNDVLWTIRMAASSAPICRMPEKHGPTEVHPGETAGSLHLGRIVLDPVPSRTDSAGYRRTCVTSHSDVSMLAISPHHCLSFSTVGGPIPACLIAPHPGEWIKRRARVYWQLMAQHCVLHATSLSVWGWLPQNGLYEASFWLRGKTKGSSRRWWSTCTRSVLQSIKRDGAWSPCFFRCDQTPD
ncbi:hypothetical protein BCV70DRAFT_99659 [Testicularia cyperi]|uniref:Uncharacterized protein n=1 Tax=Testicularia cyperi TaxID=1882483 RepID=A0A317XQX3_9BASI|nr:hypothetical protein BCV70DRAFT_99659 [Testicularia cyperi]